MHRVMHGLARVLHPAGGQKRSVPLAKEYGSTAFAANHCRKLASDRDAKATNIGNGYGHNQFQSHELLPRFPPKRSNVG